MFPAIFIPLIIRPFPTDQNIARCLQEKQKNMQQKAGGDQDPWWILGWSTSETLRCREVPRESPGVKVVGCPPELQENEEYAHSSQSNGFGSYLCILYILLMHFIGMHGVTSLSRGRDGPIPNYRPSANRYVPCAKGCADCVLLCTRCQPLEHFQWHRSLLCQ